MFTVVTMFHCVQVQYRDIACKIKTGFVVELSLFVFFAGGGLWEKTDSSAPWTSPNISVVCRPQPEQFRQLRFDVKRARMKHQWAPFTFTKGTRFDFKSFPGKNPKKTHWCWWKRWNFDLIQLCYSLLPRKPSSGKWGEESSQYRYDWIWRGAAQPTTRSFFPWCFAKGELRWWIKTNDVYVYIYILFIFLCITPYSSHLVKYWIQCHVIELSSTCMKCHPRWMHCWINF